MVMSSLFRSRGLLVQQHDVREGRGRGTTAGHPLGLPGHMQSESNIEEGLRQKKWQRSSLLFGGQNLFTFLPPGLLYFALGRF